MLSYEINHGKLRPMVELWPVVDENDKILSLQSRSSVHGNNLRHRTVAVAVFNDQEQVLLQLRSPNKDLYPSMYTMSATGHVIGKEDYLESAYREFQEELQVKPDKLIYVDTIKIDEPTHPSMTALYTTRHNGPFNPNLEELQGVEFIDPGLIKKMEQKITPPARVMLRRLGLL